MANYYTEMSVLLPNDGSEKDKAEAREFLMSWYKEEAVNDNNVGFASEWDTMTDSIWVHEWENADIEEAVIFVQKYLRYMGMDGGVYFSWANTCSNPRVNEATGGEVVVTRTEVFWNNPGRLIDEVKAKGVEVLNG